MAKMLTLLKTAIVMPLTSMVSCGKGKPLTICCHAFGLCSAPVMFLLLSDIQYFLDYILGLEYIPVSIISMSILQLKLIIPW